MKRLIIKNFGPLKDIDLDIRGLNLYIGPQGTGKTTLLKLVSVGYQFREFFIDFFQQALESQAFGFFPNPKQRFDEGIQNGLTGWLNTRLPRFEADQDWGSIQFELKSNWSLTLSPIPGNVACNPDRRGWEILNAIFLDIQKAVAQTADFDPSALDPVDRFRLYTPLVSKFIYRLFGAGKDLVFVPESRALRSNLLLQQIIFPGYGGWGAIYDQQVLKAYQTGFPDQPATDEAKVGAGLAEKLGQGYWLAGGEFRTSDGAHTKYFSTSAGQRETFGLLSFILDYLNLPPEKRRPTILMMEEPETHLYPMSQVHMVRILALFLNAHPENQLFVNTHSPYVVSATNNLLYAWKVGQRKPQEVNLIIPEIFWYPAKNTVANKLGEGENVSMYDEEFDLLHAEHIDDASGLINEDFDRVFDLQQELV